MDGQELVLSKSSIDVWSSCHRKYMYAYLYRIPGGTNLDMAVGTAVHAAAEAHWKGKDPEEALAVAMAGELALIPGLIPIEAAGAVAVALGLWQTYLAKIVPTFPVPPTIIERDFLISVNGVLVSGRIDVATEGPDEVRDTKTTSTPSKVTPERHQLGMTLYSWGFQALTGRLPKRLLLDTIGRNGRWAIKTVEPDYQGTAEVVGLVAAGIAAGNFAPTGAASGQCWRCPYAQICPDSTAKTDPI